MPLLLRNITLGLDELEEVLPARAARRLKLPVDAIRAWGIVRRSIDARMGQVRLSYSVELALDSTRRERRIAKRLHRTDVSVLRPAPPLQPRIGGQPMPDRPIIIGFGPAGMFAALLLAEHGYRPIVLERGQPIRQRHVDVMKRFWRERDFDPESNMLFGEGGAGCYSDGKLRTRINDPRVERVLQTLYEHGAHADVLIDSRPHIGSDRLPQICRRIRGKIEQLGGEVRFGQRVDGIDLDAETGLARQLRVLSGRAIQLLNEREAGTDGTPVLLGPGHSARDTFKMLAEAGVALAVKPFQVGVRVEHPQDTIDRWQYGPSAGHPRLGAASYQVVAKGAGGSHGDVFSFCMCPGGQIVPCNESANLVAVNGASRSKRGGGMGNTGLVLTLTTDDVGTDPLRVLAMLEDWERRAFQAGGGDYAVPIQRASDLVSGRVSEGQIATTYPLGGRWCDLRGILPGFLTDALSDALQMLDRRMPGFAGSDALLAAPETRASCPIRILRDKQTRASVSAGNLYPIGEGAGYAGGIMSSAVDGLRTAEVVMARFAPPR
jgi:uncharacterized protein